MSGMHRQPARDRDTVAVSLAASAAGEQRVIAASHNWIEVIASYPPTVTAGDVLVYRREANPENNTVVNALIGTLAYAVNGAGQTFHVPPGSRIAFQTTGYSGSGTITAILSSWCEQ